MQETQSLSSISQEEVGLLDILLTLAENAKLLIIGPLLVGLCTLGISYVLPQTFESVAVLQADQVTASLMTTASVLDPVAGKLGLSNGESVEESRNKLRKSIKATVSRSEKLLTLTVSASMPQQAQAIATAVLEQTFLQSRVKGSVRARLEVQLAEARGRLKNAESAASNLFKRIESPVVSVAGGNELARGYAELLSVAGTAQTQISALEAQAEGLSDGQLLQRPTLPQQASQPKKALLAIGSTLATGLLLLLFIFVRQLLCNTSGASGVALQLARIRQALGLK